MGIPPQSRALRAAELGAAGIRGFSRRSTRRSDTDPEPKFDEVLDLDLGKIEPSLAGPKRPQDRVSLAGVSKSFKTAFDGVALGVESKALARLVGEGGNPAGEILESPLEHLGQPQSAGSVTHGSVVIAAITSCTNTSNPSVMIAAGLLARKAVEAGLKCKPWVRTSLAPGSRVVTRYLDKAGLTPYLEKLGFNLVGYGCTTCIGNSGPLPAEVAEVVTRKDLAVAAVLSGNRNFEGRIHAQVKASYLASPPLCVAYALAGTVMCDLTADPLGNGADGRPIYLKDIWPTAEEVQSLVSASVSSDEFDLEYRRIFAGDAKWKSMPAPSGTLFAWDETSTYVREPPLLHRVRRPARNAAGHQGGAGACPAGRLDHHRPYFARGRYTGRFSGGEISLGVFRAAGRVQ